MRAGTPKRIAVASAVAVSVGLALVGCSESSDPAPTKPAASSFVGKTLQYALDHTPGSVASKDASKALGLRPRSPDPTAIETVVIAACYFNDTQVNVMVIPRANFTGTIGEDARHGAYDSLLTDCEK